MAKRNRTLPMSANATDTETQAPAAKPAKVLFHKPGSNRYSALFTTLIEGVKASADTTNEIAKEALNGGDRKAVLAAMKAGTSLVRTQTTIEKILARSERVRLSKDERAAYDKDGTLPEGVKVVTDDEGDDDENDEE
jgi:hypothetical protein